MEVHFYEKPGCINNTKQKRMLEEMGHYVISHSILTTTWSTKSLRKFFGDMQVSEWFNTSAPQIKEGKLNPNEFDEGNALTVMIADPLLIRRPLIAVNGQYVCGFDNKIVNHLLDNSDVSHLLKCPNISSDNSCDRL